MLYREMKRRVTLDKWSVHSYYTLNPYAPDGSGRLLFAAADFETGTGKVYIADNDGKVVDSFGENKYSSSFFHTGFGRPGVPTAGLYITRAVQTPCRILCEESFPPDWKHA